MTIRTLIQDVAAGWEAYHKAGRVNKKAPIYSMVVNEFPEELRPNLATFDNIAIEGSTGKGEITAAPWIAVFDHRLTTSATTEYYVVYLFSTDLSTITLTLAFGTTQFAKQFGGPSKAFPRMRSAAARIQEMFRHLIPKYLSKEPIDLGAQRRQKLHYAYQKAAILSLAPYRIDALPPEEQLVSDLQLMVRLYTEMVSDPLEATVERLVEAVVEPADEIKTIEVRAFAPRKAKKQKKEGNQKKHSRRYSPESRKVGNAGEKLVFVRERERLMKLGHQDLADRVRWHSQEQDFPGWDVTSFDDEGEEFFIEVKSSVGKSVSCVDLTVNEWDAACDAVRRDRYWIYIVTQALSSTPKIELLRNPADYVNRKQLSCEAIVYELRLGPD